MPDPSVARFTYRAFISYSHRDKAWGDWLHKALETYRVPSRLVGTTTAHGVIPRRLNPVFRDREELSSAPELGSRINQALAQSENLIVICSPAAAASRWVNEEVLAYKRMGRAERIFCLIVDGEPGASEMPGRAAEECFCPALRYQLDANGQPTSERTEPIAADARQGKDGKANAKLKLIAGMLGVGFDALKQRELQRRTRRMTAIAGMALGVMAVTVVLAIFALISRNDALIAQQAAERRQKQSEDLIDFMLGDLTSKLQAESRLDILDDVFNKAMVYFKSLPPTDITDATLVKRALALERIGDNRMREGHLAAALEAQHASAAISSRLAAAAPKDVDRQLSYSRTLTYICMIGLMQRKLTDAQRACSTARQVLQPSLRQAPTNIDLLQQLSYVENNSGHALQLLGNLEGANTEFGALLAVARKLVAAKPDEADFRVILILAHKSLADLALQGGNLAEAIAQYRAATAAGVAASSRFPKNNALLSFAAAAPAGLGNTLLLAGSSAHGVQRLQEVIGIEKQLITRDPTNTDYQLSLGLYVSGLSRWQRLDGHLDIAKTLNRRASTVFSALIKKDASNHNWQRGYAVALTEAAAQSRAASDAGSAQSQAQAALYILDPMRAKDPAARETLLDATAAKLLLASVTDDAGAAQRLREQALQSMRAVKAGQNDPRLLALEVEALLALDQTANTQPLIKQLWNQGYRDPEFVARMQREHIAYPVNRAFQARLLAATTHASDGAAVPSSTATDKAK